MNIYLVSRTDIADYDEYNAFVIIAANETIAKDMAKEKMDGTFYKFPLDILEAEVIGTTQEKEAQIVLADFFAG